MGDCAGGLIAALIALPYGLSMAALMGLPPVLGVVTSIMTAPITAIFGRNPVLIGGTASVTVPFIAHAVQSQGIGGAAKVTMVASVLMMVFCVLRLGRYAAMVPATVVAGFSAGIGAIMVISQLSAIFGVHPPPSTSNNSLGQLAAVIGELGGTRWAPLLLGVIVIAASALVMRWSPKLPAPLIGVALATIAARMLFLHEREVGNLPLSMPPFANFAWTSDDVWHVLPAGLMLAFVSAANLLLTSRAVEHFRGKHKQLKRSDADAELGAYGIANLTVGIFGAPMSIGIPARSVANVRCGGTTRVSNLMHGLFLFLMVSMGAGVLAHIPMAALAGVTAWMGFCLLDVSTWRRLGKMRVTDASAFLVTAIGVLVVNAVAAVFAGCAIYLVHYLYVRYVRVPGAVQGVPSIAK